jgi:hypothetical protein
MRIPRPCLIAFALVATASAVALSDRDANATKAGGVGETDGACLEKFHECQRGCGPSPGTADPQCMRYCEEQVLARCRAGGAALKSQAIKPGAVNGGLKATPK